MKAGFEGTMLCRPCLVETGRKRRFSLLCTKSTQIDQIDAYTGTNGAFSSLSWLGNLKVALPSRDSRGEASTARFEAGGVCTVLVRSFSNLGICTLRTRGLSLRLTTNAAIARAWRVEVEHVSFFSQPFEL